jgi:hypothetical protein
VTSELSWSDFTSRLSNHYGLFRLQFSVYFARAASFGYSFDGLVVMVFPLQFSVYFAWASPANLSTALVRKCLVMHKPRKTFFALLRVLANINY